MAYDYKQRKSMYTAMSDTQRQRASDKLRDNADWQRFNQDYENETGNRNPYFSQMPQPQNTYGDLGWASQSLSYQGQGVGWTKGYQYNPNLNTNGLDNWALSFGNWATYRERNTPGYIEDRNNQIANALYNEGKTDEASIRNYLNNFSEFRSYDQLGQDNTVASISKRMGQIQSQWGNQGRNQNYNTTNGTGILGDSSVPQDFWEATNKKLKEAYGIEDLNALREKYPSEYEGLMKNLNSLQWVWNATDPNSRKLLEGHLQGVLGVATGAWSDKSVLRWVESALLNKFENPDQIKKDTENIIRLQKEWLSTSEIASQMGMSEDQVHQLNLLANGLDSRAWEYYKLKKVEADKITEPFDDKIKKLDEDKKIALERANRNVEWHKQDFDTAMERQKKQNEINAHNADMLAGKYGFAFSKRGMEGLNYIWEQAQNIINDLIKNYDRGHQEMADGISDIMRNRKWNNKELMKASQEALNQAKNNFTSGVLQVQQKYGTIGLQAQQAFAQAVQGFISQAEDIYDKALKRQQDNLTNLITNASNLNAMQVNNFNLRNAKVQQFQAESLGLNREQLFDLAKELWIPGGYQKLQSYQIQSAQNVLNGYASGAGMAFGESVKNMINQWYTPEQAIGAVVQSNSFAEYKKKIESKWDSWAMSDGVLYNKTTGEIKNTGGWSGWKLMPIGKDTRGFYDPKTGNIINIDQLNQTASGWSPIGATESLASFASKYPVGSKGGQCWSFVNDYLQSMGGSRIFSDPIKDKKAHINLSTPTVWSVAIMNSSKYPQYGHVAIVTAVHEDGSITTLESNRYDESIGKWDEKVFTRTFKPTTSGKNMVFGYHVPQWTANAQNSNEPLSSNGIPISYEQKIYNLVPTSLKNSDTELKNLYTKAKQLYDTGMSAEDAALTFLWFKIKESKKEFATNLVDHARIWEVNDNFYGVLSDYVNKGKDIEAVKYMERTLIDNSKTKSNVKESTAIATIKKIQDFERQIKQAEGKFWPISGRLNSAWTTRYGSDKTQGIKSDLVHLFAGIRNQISGANVTAEEKKYLEPMIPDLNDKYENVQAKLRSMKQNILQDLNGVRQDLNLPALDENTLVNTNQRVKLYLPVNKSTVPQKKVKVNTWGFLWGITNNIFGNLLQNWWRR